MQGAHRTRRTRGRESFGRQGQPEHDGPALAHRSPRAAPRRPRAARRGGVARHDRAHREHDSPGSSAHHGLRHLRQDPARTGGGEGDVALEIRPMVHIGHQARTHRARAAPISEGSSPLRGAPRQRHGIAPRREPRAREAHPLAPQRAHERRRPRGLRLAAGLRALHRRRVPRHRRGRPVPAPRVLVWPDAMLVLVLHLRIAIGPAPGRRAPPRPVCEVRPARAAHRPQVAWRTQRRHADHARGHKRIRSLLEGRRR